uniref:Uncharacterized protein n=1 Tax=Rhizophora mucronata TaxID=61149 RepID=A0A2P2PHK3_RHIMU
MDFRSETSGKFLVKIQTQ